MRQGIEKQQETTSAQSSVTVMFHDREMVLDVIDSFRSRASTAPSLSGSLTGDVIVPVVSSVPSLPSHLKVSAPRARIRYRTRSRTTPPINKFSAEEPMALSAWFVFGASPNTCSETAAAIVITTMTEQRRCAAA